MKIKYRKLPNGNYVGRCKLFYIFLRKKENWDKSRHWYTATISFDKQIISSEGLLSTSLDSIIKAKGWAKKRIELLSN